MKRTLKRTDGTEEVIEGTPEELAAHERALRDAGKLVPESIKKPEVLKGKELQDALEEWLKIFKPEPSSPLTPPWYTGPIWVVSCSICGRINCAGNCVSWGQSPFICTVSSNTLKFPPD